MKREHQELIDGLEAMQQAPIAPGYCSIAKRAAQAIRDLTADVEKLAATMFVTALAAENEPDPMDDDD